MNDPTPVPRGLQMSAAYAWRILVLVGAAYVVLFLVGRLQFVFVALFVGLIIAALLGPLVRIFSLVMWRGLAVGLALFVLILGGLAVITFIAGSIAGEWGTLTQQFGDGLVQIQTWLQGPPFEVEQADFDRWYTAAQSWVSENQGQLAQGALGSASTIVEGVAGFALAMFSAVCFLSGGRGIWHFGVNLFPSDVRPRIDGAGHVAWRSFAGYTRGIIIVAATNGFIVCILLLILQVPLAIPLALLVFFGTFIPLIGAPVAMFIAVIVALAARGPLIAIIVLIGIALVGQFEGHVLQPLVMSRAVHIHPLAVALAVVAGGILGGLVGAIVAVPVVSVIYGVLKFWFQTAPPDNPGENTLAEPDPEAAI